MGMKPTLRQLEYLVAVAETGTFSRAAKRTFVSQPSLSMQIKDMEVHVGAQLVERGRHGAILTPIGEELVIRARIILRHIEELKVVARESEGSLAGRVKLGVLPSLGPYLLPQATRKLHTAYPDLRLNVREDRVSELTESLLNGSCDAILSTPEHHKDMRHWPIVEENIYACVAHDDELAKDKSPITLEALKGRELLTLGYGHKFTAFVMSLADMSGASVLDEYQGTSFDAIRQMASMGGGVAILPSLYAISEAKRDPELIVRKIDHPLANRSVSLIWRQTSPLSQKFEKIGLVLRDAADVIMG